MFMWMKLTARYVYEFRGLGTLGFSLVSSDASGYAFGGLIFVQRRRWTRFKVRFWFCDPLI